MVTQYIIQKCNEIFIGTSVYSGLSFGCGIVVCVLRTVSKISDSMVMMEALAV